MRVAIWGAGNLGGSLARRLVTVPWVSELHWINRSYDKIDRQSVDIEHGLAFSPTCHTIGRWNHDFAPNVLEKVDALVITAGTPVPPGATRKTVYSDNRDKVFRSCILPTLKQFRGVVLVVTNPVDLMTRLVYLESIKDERRVLGLGTVVETARLRWSLSDRLRPRRAPKDIPAYAIGTHDERFVPVAPHNVLAPDITEDEFNATLKGALKEVSVAATRVKGKGDGATLHPVVEGILQVLEAIAEDSRTLLTVSVKDPDTSNDLFYSVPCRVGRTGVHTRLPELCVSSDISGALKACRDHLSDIIVGE